MHNNSIHSNISFSQKYRVILTQKCPRTCPGCINTVDGVLNKAKHLTLPEIKADGDDIVLTGGDPAIYPKLQQVIEELRNINPLSKLFVYSSKVTKLLLSSMEKLDGVTFTLHYPLSLKDINEFNLFQKTARSIKAKKPEKSYRLCVDSRINQKELSIDKDLYSRLDTIKWMNREEILAQKDRNFGCPKDEQLVLLKE